MEILIKACLANQRKSQKEFYLLTSDKLMNVARRYATNIDDAKDILQNSYIKIFKYLSEYDSKRGSIESWLVKIVVNEALQMIRKQKTISLKEHLAGEEFEIISTPDIIARLNAEDVLKLMRLLPDGYRIVFNMAVVEGYSHKEIGESLNITESTSRSQLVRAKKMLKELLENQKISELC